METMEKRPEVKPEIVFIYDLIRHVESGKIRIPAFQRLFVWNKEDMLDLLDSIRNQYPIGSLLLWMTEIPLNSREWVGPVRVARKQMNRVSYILDGQQRLSTLVGTLRMPQSEGPSTDQNDTSCWRVYFNAEKEILEYLREGANPERPKGYHFPMWKLMDTYAFLEEGQRILKESGEQGQLYLKRVQELARTFQSYKLPVISIENTELSQAVTIFSRLNAKGRSISTDEMVSALTYRENISGQPDFHLSNQIDMLTEKIGAYHFGGMDRTVVLRAFLAAIDEDIYRTDWTQMTEPDKTKMQDKFVSAMEKTGYALVNAIQFLNTLGVRTDRLLPYAMQLVVLSAFFLECTEPSQEQQAFLRRWFWVSSFTGWFGSGNPSRVAGMVREFKNHIAKNSHPDRLDNMEFRTPAQPFSKTFDTRNARTRTLILLLLDQKPLGSDGKELVDIWRVIAEQGPSAFGYIFLKVDNKELKSSPANRMLRMREEGGIQGREWLINLQHLESSQRRAILLSHSIPEEAFPNLLAGQHEAFLNKRMEYMRQLEKKVMRREGVVLPTGENG